MWMTCLPMFRTKALLTVFLGHSSFIMPPTVRPIFQKQKRNHGSQSIILLLPERWCKKVQADLGATLLHWVTFSLITMNTYTLLLIFIPCSLTICSCFLSWNSMEKCVASQINTLMEYELAFFPLPKPCFRSFVRPTYRTECTVSCTQLQPFYFLQNSDAHPPIPTQTHAYTLKGPLHLSIGVPPILLANL